MNKDRLKWIITGLNFDLLTDWEERFVESVETFFKSRGYLSDKQEEILEKIYKEKSK